MPARAHYAAGLAAALVAALATVVVGPAAAVANRQRARRTQFHCVEGASCSVGLANAGRLYNPALLPQCEFVHYSSHGQQRYGTTELVALLDRTARTLYARYHVPLTVGDLSAPNGGRLSHHNSHQSGRDADIPFFVMDPAGRSVHVEDWPVFRGDGTAARNPVLRFDTARNWALVRALIEDPVPVEHVFVSRGLRALLLGYARTINAPADVIARAEVLLHQPDGALPHNDHFHVRVACREGDGRCFDAGRGMLARADRAAQIARRALAQTAPAGDETQPEVPSPRAHGAR